MTELNRESTLNRECAMTLSSQAEVKNIDARKQKLAELIKNNINDAINQGDYCTGFHVFYPLIDILEQKKEYEAKGFDFYIHDEFFSNGEFYKVCIFWDKDKKPQKLKYFMYECDCGYKTCYTNRVRVYHCGKKLKGRKMYT